MSRHLNTRLAFLVVVLMLCSGCATNPLTGRSQLVLLPEDGFLESLDTAHAYNEVGEAAMRNGDHQIAKAYFENATNASPIYFEQAHKNLAVANEELLGRNLKGGS